MGSNNSSRHFASDRLQRQDPSAASGHLHVDEARAHGRHLSIRIRGKGLRRDGIGEVQGMPRLACFRQAEVQRLGPGPSEKRQRLLRAIRRGMGTPATYHAAGPGSRRL